MTTGSAEMRILTVRQPWAWAIIHGGKDVENRSANLAGDYRGPIAIHAGQNPDPDGFRDPEIIGRVAMTKLFEPPDQWFSNSPKGRILGVVDLVDVHTPGCAACSLWAMDGHYHLQLASPRPLRTPIPYKGALGLRNLPSDTTQQIMEGLAT